ncbi:hypothetical protein ACFQ0D_35950, partial [Micromonospora zhanjiangensis]
MSTSSFDRRRFLRTTAVAGTAAASAVALGAPAHAGP